MSESCYVCGRTLVREDELAVGMCAICANEEMPAVKIVSSPKLKTQAHSYAERLAYSIWEQHYKGQSPDWKPLPDLLGLLTQIDNMVAGMERKSK